MAGTVEAVDKIVLFRIEGEEGNAWKVAYQTEITTEESREYDSEATKDGTVKSAGAYEGTHSFTAFLSKKDEYIKKIKALVRDASPKKLEVWVIDRSDLDGALNLPGEYSTDVVTSVSESAGADGKVEVSVDSEVEGTIIAGDVTVTPELTAMLKQIAEEQEFVQPITPTP